MIELKATMKATRYGDHTCTVWRRFAGTRWYACEEYQELTLTEAEQVLEDLVTALLTGRHELYRATS